MNQRQGLLAGNQSGKGSIGNGRRPANQRIECGDPTKQCKPVFDDKEADALIDTYTYSGDDGTEGHGYHIAKDSTLKVRCNCVKPVGS